MSWKTISLCLCIYGILKEFRPSESYVIPYLQGPRMNFTEEQINNKILPIGVYASMISMIFVSLTTDWLRYKIVIVIQALCGVCIYALLSLLTSFTSVVIVEILYGIFVATEVAYYTYIYSVVDVKYYQQVTSHTRTAHLIGRFFSGIISQVLISTDIVDSYQLNFITLGSLGTATIWSLVLPPVKEIESEAYQQKVVEMEIQQMNPIKTKTQTINEMETETKLVEDNEGQVENPIEDNKMSWKYVKSMCNEYNNSYILKWSFWVITATCCFNQVSFYIQSLWESLSHDKCLHADCKKTSEWNGAVDALYTIISAYVTYECGSIKLNMDKYCNLLIMVASFLQCATLYSSIIYNSIYISYINYIIYNTIYQAVMTIASSEIARCVSKDKHGFVFGINNLLAAVLQSFATFFMSSLSSSKILMFYTDFEDNSSSGNGQNVSVKLYESEWKYLFNIDDIDELRDIAIKGELRTSRFRSICWRLLLGLLPSDSSEWLITIEKFRSTYEQTKLIHYNDPHTQDSGPDNPLSLDDDSIWKQYFKDMELKKIIQQDVIRTSPGVEFFRTEKIQKIMVDLLFCYSREHPDLSYRQGMHEILAPLLFVLHCDHQALLHVLEQSSSDVSDLIKKILEPAYLEADAYSLFNTIMEIMKDYYNINDFVTSTPKESETVKTTSLTSESEVVRKLSKIRNTMLTRHDPELHEHLLALDISFTTFGVRWLRLLFGGEFSLMDLLVLWDTIFAKSPENFAIVNDIFVAMLVLLRAQLLKNDNTNCLHYLMRYPHVDVMTVIEYALHMSDPKKHLLPSVINSLKIDKSENIKTNITDDQSERPNKFVNTYSTRHIHSSSDDLLELCRVKLLQYHSILNPIVPNHNKEARQALSGILELCGMLNLRPGIIEMGKDIVRSTTVIQAPLTPETPDSGPILPPPASAITMKVFRKIESSTDSQIQGAPTKNPLKQMKR
ncbi:uncharacterized protein LOC112684297 isoform X2 [Sipha flava]|nr:uncharacterized protein LOC112684297 isoform X2 [Sipha flava]XP_025411518.1 uncharacterized protein LOC112684297 isoform X2 [Sipha flava]